MTSSRWGMLVVMALLLVACDGLPKPITGSVTSRLLAAYNAGQLDAVLAVLDDDIVWSDCDYRAGQAVGFTGKANLTGWLRQRLAERDYLEAELIEEPAGTPPVGAIAYRRRASDTLRALGFPDGIRPLTGTKVALTSSGDRVAIFANGPLGGALVACRP